MTEIFRTGKVVRCPGGELAVRFLQPRCVGCTGCGRSIFFTPEAQAEVGGYTLPLPQMGGGAHSGQRPVGEGDVVQVRIAAQDLLRLCLLLFGTPLGLMLAGAAVFSLGPLSLSVKILFGSALLGGWIVLLNRYRRRLNVHIRGLLQFAPVTNSAPSPPRHR